jgi:hypothetical protein
MNGWGGHYGIYVSDTDKCIVQEEMNLPYMPIRNTITTKEYEELLI